MGSVIDLVPDTVDVIDADQPLGILFSVDEGSSTDEQLLLASSVGVESFYLTKTLSVEFLAVCKMQEPPSLGYNMRLKLPRWPKLNGHCMAKRSI